MRQYKLRKLVVSGSKNKNGITIPSGVTTRFGLGTLFSITVSGNNILLESGCSWNLSDKEIEKMDLKQYEVKTLS